jgi:hypothetical protein
MRALIAIQAKDRDDGASLRMVQYMRNEFARALRDLASCVEQGRAEGTLERPTLTATWRLEQQSGVRTVFHVKDGPAEMIEAEAARVVRDFAQERSARPWDAGKKPAAATTKNQGIRQ